MCKKLVICRYIGFNPSNELCTVGRNREDGTVFTIAEKEYVTNYIKEKA